MKIEEQLNEITFGLYDQGFLDGQHAMISSMVNLGLIREEMGGLLQGVLSGKVNFMEYFSNIGASKKAMEATKKIMEL